MPSVGGDAPYGSAGRVHADSRDSDAAAPGAGPPASGGGRHVADVGSGLPGGPAGTGADDAGLPYAFRRGRRTTTGAETTGGSTAGADTAAGGDAGLPYAYRGGGSPEPGPAGDAVPLAFRRGRHGDTTGAGLTVREVRGGLGRLARGEWRPALALLAGGLLVAAVWRTLGPTVADRGNPLEADVAVDGTLAALGILAGVVTSALVLLLPGRYPVRRTLVVVAFSVLGSVVSWQVGDLLGTPHLRAYGIVLIWPIITSAGLFAGSLLPGLSRRLED
jgi:hypothetical protein